MNLGRNAGILYFESAQSDELILFHWKDFVALKCDQGILF